MNLLFSTITTGLIVAGVWTVAVLQPQANNTASNQSLVASQSLVPQASIESAKPKLPENIKDKPVVFVHKPEIVGVTKTITLDQLPALWGEFNDNSLLHAGLQTNPSKVYVYYRDFAANYTKSRITIGYDISELTGFNAGIELTDNKFQLLLDKAKYSDAQLSKAWNQINYIASPQAVLEVHHLNNDGTTQASELFVNYK